MECKGEEKEGKWKIPPKEVMELMSSRGHRLHHFVWHQVRNNWYQYPDEIKEQISKLGWTPGGDPTNPRPAYYKGDNSRGRYPALDNNSGEDFLYMHRWMIEQVNELLSKLNDPNYPKIEGWKELPDPSDKRYPVPPLWGDERYRQVKSDDYFKNTMQVWEKYYLSNDNLRLLSLGQLGSLIETTIHNAMHNRWSSDPGTVIRPQPKPEDPAGIPEGEWDKPSYDFLGDTYSSHVNPRFWYIHGWVDYCIDRWKDANSIKEIIWKGKWIGKIPQGESSGNMENMFHKPDPHHGHHGGNELNEVVRLIGKCGIWTDFYTWL
jgi:hypothetical protein